MTLKAIMQRDTNKFVAKKKTIISPLLFAGLIVRNHVKIVVSLFFFNANYYLQLFHFFFVVIFACPQNFFQVRNKVVIKQKLPVIT